MADPLQRSLEDLGTPLADVTFCIVDLETTGISPAECSITEIGAVKLRGGECLGTLPYGAAAEFEWLPRILRLLVRVNPCPYFKAGVARRNRTNFIMRKHNLIGEVAVIVIAAFFEDKAIINLFGK